MKDLGTTLIWAGAAAAAGSFFIPTSIDVSPLTSSSYSAALPSAVTNLARLQRQTMVFQSRLALFLAGAIFYAAAFIGGHHPTRHWPAIWSKRAA